MASPFIIKRNDTLPALELTLVDRGRLGEKMGYNLSGVTEITFTMVSSCGEYKIFAQSAETVCYSGGTIRYNWRSGDTNESGKFSGEFQLTFSDGNRLSVPQNGQIQIEIGKDVNPY